MRAEDLRVARPPFRTLAGAMFASVLFRYGTTAVAFGLCYLIALPISLVFTGFVFDACWRRNKARNVGKIQVVANKWQLVTAVVTCGAVLSIGVAFLVAFVWNNIILANPLLG